MRFATAVAAALLFPVAGFAQTGANVLVVINEHSQDSVQLGQYYARTRTVPANHIVRIQSTTEDTIQRADFERTIEGPIAVWLTRHGLQDQVLYVVLTKGIPLRIAGTGGRDGQRASVDSELTLLYRKLTGESVFVAGRVENPYYLGDAATTEAKPFTRFAADTYLVTRLDGFTLEDAIRLVDRAAIPSREGKIVLDQRVTVVDGAGDRWLDAAAERLRQGNSGDRVFLEDTRGVATLSGPVLGYYSWGSNDPANRLRRFGLEFANGAIGGMFLSSDGRTFIEPPKEWVPVDSDRPRGLFGKGSQSLAGDLIRDGMTGVSAYVDEPFLDGTVRPQILFPAYLSGRNLAESFYLSIPFLSWQTIVVGDPLCAPFRRERFSPEELHQGVDPDTELPALFSRRRLAVLSRKGFKAEALKLALKAQARIARHDREQAIELLLAATALEPRMIDAQMQIAAYFDQRGEYAKAIERYRQIVHVEPRNAMALNNLAYDLAVHAGAPKEALPFAERADRLSTSPMIVDTVGWIHHLLGNNRLAAVLLERAVAAAPTNVEILIHAAVVHTALNDFARARREIAAAEKIDPSIVDRTDVKALRKKLK